MTAGNHDADRQERRAADGGAAGRRRARSTVAAAPGRARRPGGAGARMRREIDDLVRRLADRGRAGDRPALRRVRARRVRPPDALPALGHRPADRLRRADWRRRGALRQRAAAAALGPRSSPSVTTSASCREFDVIDDQNPEFLMALCDLRLLTGDVRLFDDVCARAHRGDATTGRRGSWTVLLALIDERYAEFNDTLYQLEPDMKKAPGRPARHLGRPADPVARARRVRRPRAARGRAARRGRGVPVPCPLRPARR